MPRSRRPIDAELAWQLLLAGKRHVRRGGALAGRTFIRRDAVGDPPELELVASPDAPGERALVRFGDRQDLVPLAPLEPEAERLFDLYLPIASASATRPLVLGHLGQSLDGRIATEGGASHYVNGPENITHLHRLRALCDAVVVGWRTVAADDPRLTVRRVPGDNPLRVVIDLEGRLTPERRVLSDGAAPTLIVIARQARPAVSDRPGVELCRLEDGAPDRSTAAIVTALRARGCACIFIEGGGRTVSTFLEQGRLDRLQVAVAPLIIGSGVAAFTLSPIAHLDHAIRPRCRIFAMGEDTLFDLDLRG